MTEHHRKQSPEERFVRLVVELLESRFQPSSLGAVAIDHGSYTHPHDLQVASFTAPQPFHAFIHVGNTPTMPRFVTQGSAFYILQVELENRRITPELISLKSILGQHNLQMPRSSVIPTLHSSAAIPIPRAAGSNVVDAEDPSRPTGSPVIASLVESKLEAAPIARNLSGTRWSEASGASGGSLLQERDATVRDRYTDLCRSHVSPHLPTNCTHELRSSRIKRPDDRGTIALDLTLEADEKMRESAGNDFAAKLFAENLRVCKDAIAVDSKAKSVQENRDAIDDSDAGSVASVKPFAIRVAPIDSSEISVIEGSLDSIHEVRTQDEALSDVIDAVLSADFWGHEVLLWD